MKAPEVAWYSDMIVDIAELYKIAVLPDEMLIELHLVDMNTSGCGFIEYANLRLWSYSNIINSVKVEFIIDIESRFEIVDEEQPEEEPKVKSPSCVRCDSIGCGMCFNYTEDYLKTCDEESIVNLYNTQYDDELNIPAIDMEEEEDIIIYKIYLNNTGFKYLCRIFNKKG